MLGGALQPFSVFFFVALASGPFDPFLFMELSMSGFPPYDHLLVAVFGSLGLLIGISLHVAHGI